ncbi:MAG TPA: DUF47 family protein [Longimicrobiaceae bacterium]|nr:DUF47 family protein [Longimicrobiaceae bacterium]
MRLIPRDEQFFDLFNELAQRLAGSARLLQKLFADPAHIGEHVAAIKELEHQADHLTHDVIDRIDRSFVTPLDREDIHLLASRLDDVIDLLDGTARRAQMFHLTETREPARQLTAVLVRAADCLVEAVGGMKKPKVVQERAREIKLMEEEGDAIYHSAIGELFQGTPNPLDVIRWKDLYDKLEDALDQCDDVANVLESISIKNS